MGRGRWEGAGGQAEAGYAGLGGGQARRAWAYSQFFNKEISTNQNLKHDVTAKTPNGYVKIALK